MIYLAMYFAFNFGVMMSDILTHKIEWYPVDYRDCIIELFVAFPVVTYVYIANIFE